MAVTSPRTPIPPGTQIIIRVPVDDGTIEVVYDVSEIGSIETTNVWREGDDLGFWRESDTLLGFELTIRAFASKARHSHRPDTRRRSSGGTIPTAG